MKDLTQCARQAITFMAKKEAKRLTVPCQELLPEHVIMALLRYGKGEPSSLC